MRPSVLLGSEESRSVPSPSGSVDSVSPIQAELSTTPRINSVVNPIRTPPHECAYDTTGVVCLKISAKNRLDGAVIVRRNKVRPFPLLRGDCIIRFQRGGE